MFQIKDDKLRAAVSVNMAKEIKLAKRWMMKAGTLPAPQLLSDLSVRLDKL